MQFVEFSLSHSKFFGFSRLITTNRDRPVQYAGKIPIVSIPRFLAGIVCLCVVVVVMLLVFRRQVRYILFLNVMLILCTYDSLLSCEIHTFVFCFSLDLTS